MKKLILSAILSIACCRCMAQAITPPVVESKASLFSCLSTLGLDTNDCYGLKADAYLPMLGETHGFSAVMIFNRKGEEIIYTKNSLSCYNPGMLLANLHFNGYPVDTAYTLSYLQERFLPLNTPGTPDTGEHDYTVVLFWVKFLGMPDNNANLREWERILRTQPHARVIKVNFDVQDKWAQKKQDEILAALQKVYEGVLGKQ